MDDLGSRADGLESRADDLGSRADGLESRADDLGSRADGLESRVDGLEPRIDDLEPQFADRLLALKKEQHDDNRGLIKQIAGLRREILFQQRRLTQFALPAPAAEQARTRARVADDRLDSFYVAFEDVFRGAREDIKRRLARYVDIVRDAGAGHLGKPLLDIGCGRGEWLELLKDKNIPAYGVDLNSLMVERTAALGLDARIGDAIEHMRGLPDGAVSAVTAFHVVERLPFAVLIDFLDEALRVLAPGGVAILETPNPESMRVGATTFYDDPTRRNPIPPQVLQFMAAHRGFQDVEILRLHPFTDGLLTQPTADAQRLNRVIFGPKDYAVIGRRL
jgi:O-antigen chain-terminating methyltransferase